jgi:hypothetical protein
MAEPTALSKTCIVCDDTKPLSDFHKNRRMRDGHVNQCKPCLYAKEKARRDANREEYLAGQRAYSAANKERKREYDAAYRDANREKLLANKREWYDANRERHLELGRAWRAANPERDAEISRTYHVKLRDELYAAVFGHYGESCACCGSTQEPTIDHVAGDGREHRELLARALGTDASLTGQRFYRWLIANDFPEGYQVLCVPCNASKGTAEYCSLDHANEAARTAHQRRGHRL